MDLIETLYAGDAGRIEVVRCAGSRADKGRPGLADRFHLVIPLHGSFVWHVGGDEIFADSGRVLFAGGGEAYAVSHPLGGDDSLVITPSRPLLDELLGASEPKTDHPILKQRWRPNAYAAQLAVRTLRAACEQDAAPLEIEERLVGLLADLTRPLDYRPRLGTRANRTLNRAKAHLHSSLSNHPSLSDIARAVGVSRTYLTRLFAAIERAPLHQYALKLRLALVLDELAQSNDLTRLALDTGFCDHSHLTATFRSRFGVPPSVIRHRFQPIARTNAEHVRAMRPLCEARGGTTKGMAAA
jgi:AraC-like DNA-binding protein